MSKKAALVILIIQIITFLTTVACLVIGIATDSFSTVLVTCPIITGACLTLAVVNYLGCR